jgi:hypothetical protein
MALAQKQQTVEEVLAEHEKEMENFNRRLASVEGRFSAQATKAGNLVTITQNDVMFGGLGAVAGAGGVYAAGHLGYVVASPTRIAIGGAVGLAAGVVGTRYWNRAK